MTALDNNRWWHWRSSGPAVCSVGVHLVLLGCLFSTPWPVPADKAKVTSPLMVVSLNQWPVAEQHESPVLPKSPVTPKSTETPATQSPPIAKLPTTSAQPQAVKANAVKTKVGKAAVASNQGAELAKTKPNIKPSAVVSTNTSSSEAAQVVGINTEQILQRAAAMSRERALSHAELSAMQQKAWSGSGNSTGATAPDWAHADVLTVFDDGRQLVKTGPDSCAIADPGADLRRDIHSIRVVPCGKNSIDTYFERVMAGVGQHQAN